MACGDAGHILLSKHVAEDLENYPRWQPHLHPLGECEVKHGVRIDIVNLYTGDLGNSQLPEKLKKQTAYRRLRRTLLAGLLILAVAFLIGLLISVRRTQPNLQSVLAMPVAEKSIAVLPFQSFGDEKQNAQLTEGVQDEILTDLAKVADLKVISRTSVMQYKTAVQRNLREIAKQLGVAHVVEGSVQRSGNRVRFSAQLIDARTDAHVWAERYDRDLADVFSLESEVAEKIVAQLKTRLSPQEKAAIEEQPTKDVVTYDLYARAKTLLENAVFNPPQPENLFEAVRLLNQAIQRDPEFALAYYQLAHAHDQLYFTGTDHTPARLEMANAACQSLARLRPNSGEAHFALAKHLYWGYRDYDRAREELELAKKSLPNDPVLFLLAGFIDRRQSRWDESTKNLERAVELHPRSAAFHQQVARSYECLRRYADAEMALDRVIALAPKDAATRASRAQIELFWHADPRPLASTIQKILTEDSREAGHIADLWLQVTLCQRNFDGASRALAALPDNGCQVETIPFPRQWCEGLVARTRGDTAAAHTAFTRVRDNAAKLVREQPAYPEALCVLGLADAILGHKADAIREGRRAVELLPVTKDAIGGALLIQYLALIYAWTGEKDLAFEQLALAARTPGYLSYGELLLHPRFEKIVADLAPKN